MTTATINTKTLLTIKVDKKLKSAAQKTAEEMGIPLGTFINMTLRQFVRDKELNFTLGYTATPALARSLKQAEKEIAKGEFEGPFPLDQLFKKLKI
jgi:addiction module RelB/DinJ family antitoxin